MTGRGVIAQKKLKNDKLRIEEIKYTTGRGASAMFESGRTPWPEHVLEARRNYVINKNKAVVQELAKYGIVV